jgi:hypothetical protein
MSDCNYYSGSSPCASPMVRTFHIYIAHKCDSIIISKKLKNNNIVIFIVILEIGIFKIAKIALYETHKTAIRKHKNRKNQNSFEKFLSLEINSNVEMLITVSESKKIIII